MNGYLLIDKDQEWTSSDVVAKLRGILHERRIGHAGTLDPMATGLLIVMVGKCTKASDYLMKHDKEYVCTLHLGLETDTQDIWGRPVSDPDSCGKDAKSVTRAELEEAISGFVGEIEQIPPMYSAIKIKGKKLYEIARRGGEVEREPRKIKVWSIDILSNEGTDWVLDIKCSSGTYVRTLCHDIGRKLGCGGCMSALRRTQIGGVRVEDAHKISEISDERYLLPPDEPLFALPEAIQRKIMGNMDA